MLIVTVLVFSIVADGLPVEVPTGRPQGEIFVGKRRSDFFCYLVAIIVRECRKKDRELISSYCWSKSVLYVASSI
jgi:hypothetical protein